jgi:hypothetical protein
MVGLDAAAANPFPHQEYEKHIRVAARRLRSCTMMDASQFEEAW